jgi:CheY-like chemotaxis protein
VRILFLDDDPSRHEEFQRQLLGLGTDITAVLTSDEAIAALKAGTFDVIFLDHDLGGQIYVPSGPGTGFEVAQRLVETPNKTAQVIVHSINEQGAREMLKVLGPPAVWVPFPQLNTIINAIKIRMRRR